MRIVIDMQGAQTESRFRGIGRYSTALTQAILRRASAHDVWVAVSAELEDGLESVRDSFRGLLPASRIVSFHTLRETKWIESGTDWRRKASAVAREAFLADIRPDVVHVSSLFEGSQDDAVLSVGKLPLGPPTSVTLYDLIPLLNPRDYLGLNWAREWYMDHIASLRRANVLLAISDHARKEAIDALEIDASSIVNISAAISDHFRPMASGALELEKLEARFGLRQPYLMYSGAIDARKNVDRLLEAFALLPSGVKATHQLVIAGKVPAADNERLLRLAAHLGIQEKLVLPGYVEESDLLLLYCASALYVFPSLHEGFGLPALEAMACGVPTIGSNTTSVPEVIGRPDALFDPTSTASMASLMERGLTDADFNRSLREHAPLQAAKFSWDESARRTLGVFEHLHETHSHRRVYGWSNSWHARDVGYERLVAAIGSLTATHDAAERSASELAGLADVIAKNQIASDHILRQGALSPSIPWRVEGPFDSSYSLALLNRETALALERLGNRVALHSTEGPGDFPASEDFLRAHADIAALHARERDIPPLEAEVTSRILYPPRVRDMQSRINVLHHYAWEESGFPGDWVDSFNDSLQGLTCLSRHVEKIMIDNGVDIPMVISGAGVDHWERIESDSAYSVPGRSFRFLHVSSCFPRKGVDALIHAYGQAFTAEDDVSLVIKTFENPHNEVRAWLAAAKADRPNFPDVVIIEQDLTESQLKGLYVLCDALVAPSRAEGFGLPMAEAMLSGLPVITTGWGGQTDFCNSETAWLVDFRFEFAQTHFELFNSVWAEPDQVDLARRMREVFESSPAERVLKVERGRALLMKSFTWDVVAQRLDSAVREFATVDLPKEPRVGWVSTWNTPCGIASYSAHLVSGMNGPLTIFGSRNGVLLSPDSADIVRCWTSGESDSLAFLALSVDAAKIDALVIQFQYAFFDLEALSRFILGQASAGRAVIVMMHATVDPAQHPHMRLAKLVSALRVCDRVLVHSPADLNRLKALGLIDNVALFPHGVIDAVPMPAAAPNAVGDFEVASYGFFLPHKGLDQLIDAISILRSRNRSVRLKMVNAEYPIAISRELIDQARAKIADARLDDVVTIVSEYLPDAESFAHLATADLVVFPYQGTGESSSAAVRYGLATGRPVAVTPLPIFDDVNKAVHFLPGTSPAEIAAGIEAHMDARGGGGADDDVERIQIMAERWRKAHRYPALSRRLLSLVRQLVARRERDR